MHHGGESGAAEDEACDDHNLRALLAFGFDTDGTRGLHDAADYVVVADGGLDFLFRFVRFVVVVLGRHAAEFDRQVQSALDNTVGTTHPLITHLRRIDIDAQRLQFAFLKRIHARLVDAISGGRQPGEQRGGCVAELLVDVIGHQFALDIST